MYELHSNQGQKAQPRFLSTDLAHAVHERQLAEHGGLSGSKDDDLLESASAHPLNKHVSGEDDLCALAAAYAFGIARNHPFNDGNTRTAWVMARLFLRLNGVNIAFDREDAIRTVLALAAGELPEDALAAWFAPVTLTKLEGGALVHARGRIWGRSSSRMCSRKSSNRSTTM